MTRTPLVRLVAAGVVAGLVVTAIPAAAQATPAAPTPTVAVATAAVDSTPGLAPGDASECLRWIKNPIVYAICLSTHR